MPVKKARIFRDCSKPNAKPPAWKRMEKVRNNQKTLRR
jgi:hypothetical protein